MQLFPLPLVLMPIDLGHGGWNHRTKERGILGILLMDKQDGANSTMRGMGTARG